jgi:hypothetical protein
VVLEENRRLAMFGSASKAHRKTHRTLLVSKKSRELAAKWKREQKRGTDQRAALRWVPG